MRFWLVLCVALFLAGCSSHRAPPPNPRLADSITVVANLNEQLRNWRERLIATAACRRAALIAPGLC